MVEAVAVFSALSLSETRKNSTDYYLKLHSYLFAYIDLISFTNSLLSTYIYLSFITNSRIPDQLCRCEGHQDGDQLRYALFS